MSVRETLLPQSQQQPTRVDSRRLAALALGLSLAATGLLLINSHSVDELRRGALLVLPLAAAICRAAWRAFAVPCAQQFGLACCALASGATPAARGVLVDAASVLSVAQFMMCVMFAVFTSTPQPMPRSKGVMTYKENADALTFLVHATLALQICAVAVDAALIWTRAASGGPEFNGRLAAFGVAVAVAATVVFLCDAESAEALRGGARLVVPVLATICRATWSAFALPCAQQSGLWSAAYLLGALREPSLLQALGSVMVVQSVLLLMVAVFVATPEPTVRPWGSPLRQEVVDSLWFTVQALFALQACVVAVDVARLRLRAVDAVADEKGEP